MIADRHRFSLRPRMRQTFKRFYKQAELETLPDGSARLLLDGKPVKTPAGRIFAIAHPRLARAISAEWGAQGETVDPASMPLTRLAMSVIDHVAPRAAAVRGEALKYGETDLLCYRAESPQSLVERQNAVWEPHLAWAREALGAHLSATSGIVAVKQSAVALQALGEALEALGPYELLAAHSLTSRLGSLVLALSVVRGRSSAAEAWAASRLDELYQAEIWGDDEEAEKRAGEIGKEVEDLSQFLALLD